jgi:hypothetical protein
MVSKSFKETSSNLNPEDGGNIFLQNVGINLISMMEAAYFSETSIYAHKGKHFHKPGNCKVLCKIWILHSESFN